MENIDLRIKIVGIVFAAICLLLILRLFSWQVVSAEKYAAIAEKQHLTSAQIPAARGKILSADGSVLAMGETAYLVYASIPDLKVTPGEITDKIASILYKYQNKVIDDPTKEKSDEEKKAEEQKFDDFKKTFETNLSQKDKVWLSLARKVSKSDKETIESMKLAGIGFTPDQTRYYPEGSMSAQLLGFVGKDDFGDDKGYFGLEGFYDGQLRGRPGKIKEEKDAFGNPILTASYFGIDPTDGRTLKTTIDRSIQYTVEQKLSKAVQKYGAKLGSVIVADPKTGAILAMANSPSFDPAKWDSYDASLYKNPLVSDTYEPGSTFKVVGMASAIDEGLVTPDTICNICDGPATIDGYTVRTWNNQYHAGSTMTEVLEHSDNVGMVFISQKLGKDRFYDFIKKFGFGKGTGIDLEGETSSILRPVGQWANIDLATASFGQGLAVTPVQMIQAVSVIANGGYLRQPYVVSQIIDGDKIIHTVPTKSQQIIKEETAKTVTEMMVNAVDKGEAQFYKPKGYSFAGKTGTAQIPIAGHYDPTKTIASFIGFAPAKDPQFIMLVRFVEPTSSIFGSETAAPTFFDIAKEILALRGIKPE